MQPNQRAVEEAKAYTEKPRGASDTRPRFALRSEAGSRERTITSLSQSTKPPSTLKCANKCCDTSLVRRVSLLQVRL